VAQSSRQRRKQRRRQKDGDAAGRAPEGATAPTPPAGETRSEAKDREAREALEPLAPGERPRAVTVGAVVAVVLAVGNAVIALTQERPGFGPYLLSALLVVMAFGMWRARYWAVLGLQTLLALMVVFAALDLFVFAQGWEIVGDVAQIATAGTLFFFLVKAMARIQMPQRP
jgi:hypothetical protein